MPARIPSPVMAGGGKGLVRSPGAMLAGCWLLLRLAGGRAAAGSTHPGSTRSREIVMADKDRLDVYAASFSSVTDAETALATIEQLYKQGAVGTMDAAVIDKENGKPHVVKRLAARPRHP